MFQIPYYTKNTANREESTKNLFFRNKSKAQKNMYKGICDLKIFLN